MRPYYLNPDDQGSWRSRSRLVMAPQQMPLKDAIIRIPSSALHCYYRDYGQDTISVSERMNQDWGQGCPHSSADPFCIMGILSSRVAFHSHYPSSSLYRLLSSCLGRHIVI